MEGLVTLYIYMILAAVAGYIPVVGTYVALANTLVHEAYHAIFGILTGGKAHSISLNHDASGLAVTSSSSWLGRILVSYAGYTGSSFTAIALFYCLYNGFYSYIVYFFIGLAVICTILWIRNFIGFIWSLTFIGALVFMVYKNIEFLMVHTSMFLSSVVLVQSITTAFTILKLSITQRKDAGDTTSLAKATFIPAAFWGLLFFGQSLFAGYFIFKHYIL